LTAWILVYRQFCKNENVKDSPVDIGAVIRFYDEAVADLPDHTRLKGMRTAGGGGVIDGKGKRFADLSESNRRIWVPLKDIPLHVQKAFLAAEDKRFYEHKGVDERGLIRAMIANLARSGRPQGGSTITQQVVKNLLVGDDVTYERKMREVIVASRVEHSLTKAEILETYLNSIYLGRGAWGIELAARTYFGKPAAALTVTEGAMLAGLTKGPTYYSPDRHPDRAQERLAYVLSRMQEDGDAGLAEVPAKTGLPQMVAYGHAAQRDSSDNSDRVTGLSYYGPDGSDNTVEADLVVLTSFIYDNTRLLLLSKTGKFPDGLANSSGQVGMLRPELHFILEWG
jgi:penicillin-binding protein 1A